MKLAIIGASGFIGLRAVEWFSLGGHAEVRAVVRSFASLAVLARQELDWRVADLLNATALTDALRGCDAVLHAAIGDPAQIVHMAEAVAEACARAGVRRLVWLSSASVHGQAPAAGTDESAPLHESADFAYNSAKVRAERRLATCREVEVVRLRPGVVFGPRSRWLADTAGHLRAGTAWWTQGGRGICNSIYVDNLLEAVNLALHTPVAAGEAFLLGDAETVSWRDVLLPIARSLGLDESAFYDAPADKIPPPKRPSRWEKLTLSPPALWLAARVADRTKRLVKGGRAAWAPPPSPANAWSLPAPRRAQLDPELGTLFQCSWKFPHAKAAHLLGYHPPIEFSEGLRRSLSWLDFLS